MQLLSEAWRCCDSLLVVASEVAVRALVSAPLLVRVVVAGGDAVAELFCAGRKKPQLNGEDGSGA